MAGGPLTRALSTEDRRAVGQKMRDTWRAADDGRATLRDSYDALLAALEGRRSAGSIWGSPGSASFSSRPLGSRGSGGIATVRRDASSC